MNPSPISWLNSVVIVGVHAISLFAIVYLVVFQFSWWTVGLAALWFGLCGLSITAGYHRLFSHPTYKAAWPIRAFYLLFGAASLQSSALKWSADHRAHHAHTDHHDDPYNADRGFWFSHVGWLFRRGATVDYGWVPDLQSDPLVRFQERHYVLLALLFGAALPFSLGLLWGDPFGALLCAGFLRLAVQWHATWSINSVAHLVGTQPYSRANSARDSWVAAIVTLGEGYHNYHHRFPIDYRNGVRWYHFDPTKWFVWILSKCGLAWDLKRISKRAIRRARVEVRRLSRRAAGRVVRAGPRTDRAARETA